MPGLPADSGRGGESRVGAGGTWGWALPGKGGCLCPASTEGTGSQDARVLFTSSVRVDGSTAWARAPALSLWHCVQNGDGI